MTQEELKKLDKKIQTIQNPFGSGLQVLKKLLWDIADKTGTTGPRILQSYIDWKLSK